MGSAHAADSPSGLYRTLLCPASRNRIAALPEIVEDESPAAREGTRAHQLLEHCLTALVRPEAMSSLSDDLGAWAVPKDMQGYIQECLDYLGGRELELMSEKPYIHSEIRVNPEIYTGAGEMVGTADVVIYSQSTMEVVDLKYGKGVKIDPENNSQLILYAAGAIAHFDAWPGSTVRLSIMQPRIPDAKRGTIRSREVSKADIISMAKEIGQKVIDARAGGHAVPGDVQCRWCPIGVDCEERANAALNNAQVMFGAVSAVEPDLIRGELLDADAGRVTSLPPEKLAAILDSLPALESYIKEVRKAALSRMTRGEEVPGFKVVAGRRSKAWAVPEEDLPAEFKRIGLKVSEYTIKKQASIAVLQPIVKNLAPAKQEKFDQLWGWKTGKPTIAPKEDEREAIKTAFPTESETSAAPDQVSFL